jgi:hypothetical protein
MDTLPATSGRVTSVRAKLDFSHRDLDSDMLEIHLAALAETPERYIGTRVARWFTFIPKNPNLCVFWRAFECKMLV